MGSSSHADIYALIERAVDEIAIRVRTSGPDDKSWVKSVDLDSVRHYLYCTHRGETDHCMGIVGNYLVLFYVVQPWWATDKILQEDLVIRVGPPEPGGLEAVADYLTLVAKNTGCKGIAVGTAFATRDKALIRAYQRLGFREESTQLYKEL